MGTTNGYDMIEGYLDGTLGPDAARELELMAAGDPELAAELRAEELIRDALARDIAALPVVASQPSPLLLTKLAASGASGATSGAAAGTVGAAVGGGVFATVFGTTTGLGIVTVVGLLGLLAGLFLFSDGRDDAGLTEPRSSATSGSASQSASENDLPVLTPRASSMANGREGEERSIDRSAVSDDHARPNRSIGAAGRAKTARSRDRGDRQEADPVVSDGSDATASDGGEGDPEKADGERRGTADATSSDEAASREPQEDPAAMIERLQREEASRPVPTVDGPEATVNIEVDPE